MNQDTIFALSTPPGKSGVAVTRISGSKTTELLLALTKSDALPPPRYASLHPLYAQNGEMLDKALILYFKAPNSFTGEDMVEFHTHGSMAVIQALVQELADYPGIRAAEPGEFMRRAFLNEKVDLLEAEAIADMIDAETSAQIRQATRQMQGHHSQFYQQLRSGILEILALLEAYIDFPEEDIPSSLLSDIAQRIEQIKQHIKPALEDNRIGERIRSGFRISIVGAPNTGKSTLLNALAGRDAAIVSAHAGTTRDLIELHMDIAGYPVILCDTAGLRQSDDEVEQLGIERSQQSLAISDMVLVMIDASDPDGTMTQALDILANNVDAIPKTIIINKCDVAASDAVEQIKQRCKAHSPTLPIITISAKSAVNLDVLETSIQQQLATLIPTEEIWITQRRHRELLEKANQHLSADISQLPLELYCEEIRLAAAHIGRITGTIITDELLDVIFSRFCIGK